MPSKKKNPKKIIEKKITGLKFKTPQALLSYLNKEYFKLHREYEEAFWLSKMGKSKKGESHMNSAMARRDSFRSNPRLLEQVQSFIDAKPNKKLQTRLEHWKRFFTIYTTPENLHPLRKEIAELESEIAEIHATREEGYIDPNTGSFVVASENKMRGMLGTEQDWRVRKACFDAMEKLPEATLPQYVKLIGLRNRYAQALGFGNFYEFKLQADENMPTSRLREIFGSIYEKTKYGFDNVRKFAAGESTNDPDQNLLKPWNFSYMMRGDITKEEDQYFPFSEVVIRWKRSMVNLGVDFANGSMTLDLLDRKGKYSNGFCHWPQLVRYSDDGRKRFPGHANFTANIVLGQIGSAEYGYHTLFHEGGHAAHMLNSRQTEVCVNHEYPPMSVSSTETQSMFMDTLGDSIEWRSRYAKCITGENSGKTYPFELYEKSISKLIILRPLALMSIIMIVDYELSLYELEASLHEQGKELTTDSVKELAVKMYKKYTFYDHPSLRILNVPHIYSWEVSAYYHGYGLAELAVFQWREHFYKKYGYIVDNPRIGRDMAKIWALGATVSTDQMMRKATGNELRPDAFIRHVTMNLDQVLDTAKKHIARMNKVKPKIKLDEKDQRKLDHLLKGKFKVVK